MLRQVLRRAFIFQLWMCQFRGWPLKNNQLKQIRQKLNTQVSARSECPWLGHSWSALRKLFTLRVIRSDVRVDLDLIKVSNCRLCRSTRVCVSVCLSVCLSVCQCLSRAGETERKIREPNLRRKSISLQLSCQPLTMKTTMEPNSPARLCWNFRKITFRRTFLWLSLKSLQKCERLLPR